MLTRASSSWRFLLAHPEKLSGVANFPTGRFDGFSFCCIHALLRCLAASWPLGRSSLHGNHISDSIYYHIGEEIAKFRPFPHMLTRAERDVTRRCGFPNLECGAETTDRASEQSAKERAIGRGYSRDSSDNFRYAVILHPQTHDESDQFR